MSFKNHEHEVNIVDALMSEHRALVLMPQNSDDDSRGRAEEHWETTIDALRAEKKSLNAIGQHAQQSVLGIIEANEIVQENRSETMYNRYILAAAAAILLMIGLAITGSQEPTEMQSARIQEPSPTDMYFVDFQAKDTGVGTREKPFNSIDSAMQQLEMGGIIMVNNSANTGNIIIDNPMLLSASNATIQIGSAQLN